ncbi:MAG: alpha/beta hydrolase [Kofleriaceae bacterium]
MWQRVVVLVALVCASGIAHAKPRWQTLPLPPAMPKPTSTGQLAVGDASIYWATYGKGEPVVLLHGGLGNADHWGFQLPVLADRFQVIAIDSRGQGRSTLSKQKLSYQVMASDVVAVLDHLAIPRASFVGWSDGGVVALDLAIRAPDRVAKLFVFGANYDSSGSKPRKGTTQTFSAYSAKCRADYRRVAKDPKAFPAVVESLMPLWRSQGGFTKEQLRSIAAPTVVAIGDHDELIRRDHVAEMAKLIPDAELVVLAKVSHFALWQDPKAFNEALLRLLVQ